PTLGSPKGQPEQEKLMRALDEAVRKLRDQADPALKPGQDKGDHFTVTFNQPRLIHSIETLTRINGRGLLNGGHLQVSTDGTNFSTGDSVDKGESRVIVKENRVRAVRLTVDTRVDVRGVIGAPEVQIGQGNVANLIGDTTISYPASGCHVDVLTNGFTLRLDSGNGNLFSCTGSIGGGGNV